MKPDKTQQAQSPEDTQLKSKQINSNQPKDQWKPLLERGASCAEWYYYPVLKLDPLNFDWLSSVYNVKQFTNQTMEQNQTFPE